MEAQHPNTVPDFKMVILANFTTPLARQIEEAETIEVGSSNPLSMNSRAEWGSTPIPQLGVTQGRVPRGARPVFHTSNILSQPTAAPQGQQAPLLGPQGPQAQAAQLQQVMAQVPQQVHLDAPLRAPGTRVPQVQ